MHLLYELFLAAHLFGLLICGAVILGLPVVLRMRQCGEAGIRGADCAAPILRQMGLVGFGLVTATGVLLIRRHGIVEAAESWFWIKLAAFALLVLGAGKFAGAFDRAVAGCLRAEIRATALATLNLTSLAIVVAATAFATG